MVFFFSLSGLKIRFGGREKLDWSQKSLKQKGDQKPKFPSWRPREEAKTQDKLSSSVDSSTDWRCLTNEHLGTLTSCERKSFTKNLNNLSRDGDLKTIAPTKMELSRYSGEPLHEPTTRPPHCSDEYTQCTVFKSPNLQEPKKALSLVSTICWHTF